MTATRSVLITGATGGIGIATLHRYAQEGYHVILADVRGDVLEARRAELVDAYPDARFDTIVLDQSSEDSVRAAAERAATLVPQLNALAIVGGIVQAVGARVTDLDVAEWDRVHAVNLRGVFLMAKYFIPLIPTDGSGSIVTIASLWGEEAHPFYSSYCTSKAAVISLTQVLAHELAADGIRVNAVAPGNIDTPMHQKALQDEADARGITFDEMAALEWSKIPVKRPGPPSCIADGIYFLTSEHASYVTGVTLDVNGGVFMK